VKVGGVQKFSLIDYPGKFSCVVFTQGCNFRCPWCHNPELVYPHLFKDTISESHIINFLSSRRSKLEAVVITGGEPTVQPDLVEFVETVKRMGFLVKLDTNGSNPDILEDLLKSKLIDYVAMDIKAPPEKYSLLTGVDVDIRTIFRSIDVIERLAQAYEFRTTFVPSLLSEDDICKIKQMIKDESRYRVQQYRCPRSKRR